MISPSQIWVILLIYLGLLLAFAFIVRSISKKKHGQGSLVRTSLPWPVLVATYLASLMSTWVFFAAPGAYYRGGVGYWMSEMSFIPLFPVIAHFTMNKVWIVNKQNGQRYSTPSDFYFERFKSPTLRVVIAIVMLFAAVPFITECIMAVASAMEHATGGQTSYIAAVIIVGLVSTLFVFVGGVTASAWADTFQGLMFFAILYIISIAGLTYGFGGTLTEALAHLWENNIEFFSYPGPSHWMPYSSRISYPLACAFGWTIMLPHVFVRIGYFGNKISTQRRMNAVAPWLQALVWTGAGLIGLTALSLNSTLTNQESELLIPYLINNYIAVGNLQFGTFLTVAFFLAVVAIALPTINGFLSVSAAIVSEDLLTKTFKLNITEKNENRVNRVIMVMMGALCTVLALYPQMLRFTLVVFADSVVVPLFIVLVFGIYWKRATRQAAVISCIAGFGLVICTYFVWGLGTAWYGTFGLITALILMPVVSLCTKQNPSDSAHFYSLLEDGIKKYYDVQEPYLGGKKIAVDA